MLRTHSIKRATFLEAALNSTVEGFYSVDTQGQTTLCNASFLRMLGYTSAEDVVGRKLHGEIHHSHPDGQHYDVADCPIYNAANSGKAAHVTYELFFRKDGSSFPVEYRAQPIYLDGVLQGAICTFVDITERLEKEKELREAQEFAASVIDSSPDCIKVLDLEGRLLSMNKAGCMQMEVDDFALCINQPWIEFWSGRDRETATKSFAGAINGRVSSFEGYCPTLQGTPKWWEVIVTPITGYSGKIERILAVSRDITARRNDQQKFRDLSDHFSLMVDSANDYAIISLDQHGDIITWSNGAERIFGHAPDDVMKANIAIIFTPEDRERGAPEAELTLAAANGRASDERWHMRKNGERFFASGTMASMHDEAGNVKGFIKIARDKTTERQAQEALLEARNAAEAANIAKTEFLANMSHEIRTPMNAIMGLTHILAISQPLTAKQRDFIKTLQSSGDSLLSLINDLLDIAKIEARTVELEHIPFDLSQLMQEIVSMMALQVKEKGLDFSAEDSDIAGRMFVSDPTRLRQIIVNLCGNAIKFTERGGVHVSMSCRPAVQTGIQTICIAVTDTGIGIAPEKCDTIFQKFMQADTSINRKYGGTGLGLAITKTLTEIMGGTIAVTSEVGKGSVFEVNIPLEIASAAVAASGSYSLAATVQSAVQKELTPHILLVEDYEANVLVATTFLEHFGYTVDVASNGVEAFELVTKVKYAAALMDVQMPGMNGFEATMLIREHERKNGLPKLPIIGMTAHALTGDRERCIASGMDDYIPKPFNPDELEAKIRTAVSYSRDDKVNLGQVPALKASRI
jgi:PAS domain S-box-containing protein